MEPNQDLDGLIHRGIGACLEVHRQLGPGHFESIYEEALGAELKHQAIGFRRQQPFEVLYKGHPVGQGRLDFLIEDRLVLELKAVESLQAVHKAQVPSYLRAMALQIGLFGQLQQRNVEAGAPQDHQ